ncbi:Gfo/Idh/MocA family protein [Sphingomonas alpina]|uniref:Gfo/Idh/MocA family oxidoreductase n=1 Tax=Sphingomonas alpina TaxID=653931 RepID=A0A7H0LG41_9SPHN|nr:Gfo/Idh/MocA family oxidoreductase [Sphingomonas alpina]QNQ08644.1 Gfo/Idh/MocA family oxidoreductase [Sphingomonas alpina]
MARHALRLGMVGGGEGAFIGAVHRMAAALDGDWRLVAGAFSTDAGRNMRTGEALDLDPTRVYPSIETMIAREQVLPADSRIDAVTIVTPNHLHAPMAIAALNAGFHVICEKPMAMNVAEAEAIAAAVAASGRRFALAFTYSGYPLIEDARARVARGDFGAIRLVQVEYLQGWLSQPIESGGNRQAEWRTDPARAGMGGCLGDIGTHAFQLAEHVSGLRVQTVCADLATHVAGRRLDDDVSVLLRFDGGARGVLKATQVAAGEENGLRLRIHGEKGGLEWAQMEPNTLVLRWLDWPTELVRAGGPGTLHGTSALFRTPAGHPEGYIEAFANIYRAFAAAIRGEPEPESRAWMPGVEAGLRTMTFVEAVVRNSASHAKWTAVDAPKSGSG